MKRKIKYLIYTSIIKNNEGSYEIILKCNICNLHEIEEKKIKEEKKMMLKVIEKERN